MRLGGQPLLTWGTEATRRADDGTAGGDRAESGGQAVGRPLGRYCTKPRRRRDAQSARDHLQVLAPQQAQNRVPLAPPPLPPASAHF